MQKHRVSLLLAALILLGGCAGDRIPGVYRIDIQQGNVVSQDAVNQLTPGMSKRQVRYIMGSPMIVDVFHQDRWDYYYSFNPGSGEGEAEQRHLVLYFQNDQLARLEGDLRPKPEAEKPKVAEPVVVPLKPEKKGFFRRMWEGMGFGGSDEEPAATDEAAPAGEAAAADQPAAEEATAGQ